MDRQELKSHFLGKSEELVTIQAEPRVSAEDYETEEVDFSTSNIFNEISDIIADDANWIARAELNAGAKYIDPAHMVKYLRTLVFMRVSWVNNSLTADYRQIRDQLFIPSFFGVIIPAIGEVDDKEDGVVLTPVFNYSDKEFDKLFLGPKDMLELSRKIGRIVDDGFKASRGWTTDKTGELDFMALTVIENTVKSYRRGSKTMAIYAALFTKMALERVTLPYRVTYGKVSQYRMDLSTLSQG